MKFAYLSISVIVTSLLCAGTAPVNDYCINSVPIFDGYTTFSTAGATTDGQPHPHCHSANSSQITRDIWFRYTAHSNSVAIDLCGSHFDTRLAVYLGADCPPPHADLIACNDDGCGDQSKVAFTAIPGQCYTIRVGGFLNSAGEGFLKIDSGCKGCGCLVQGDCCEPHQQPHCNNPDCCATVCMIDPHCCDVGWDQQCVAIAYDSCIAYCTPGHGGDVNGDGLSDVDDLMMVINSWGPCPKCLICDADLNSDQMIDVDDLLAVINHWSG